MGEKKKILKKISKRAKKALLGTTVAIILVIFGLYSGFKDILFDFKNTIDPVPNHWHCEQDNNIRGIILKEAFIKKGRKTPLNIKTGGGDASGLGEISFNFLGEHYSDDYFCFDPNKVLVHNYCSMSYKISDQGYLLVNVEMYDSQKRLVGLIEENKFLINSRCQFTWNMDETAFEVVGLNNKPVLSIEFREPDTLAIQGIFYDVDRFLVLGRGIIARPFIEDKELLREVTNHIVPIFEYTGKDWFGKRRLYE